MTAQFILRKDTPNDRIRDNIAATIARLPGSRSWEVTIKEHHRKRSDEQNRALWGHAYKILQDETGQEATDWHEYMLGEFFGWDEFEVFGRKKLRPKRRSSVLNRVEFAEFFDFIQRRAAENGIVIPDPDPFWREHEGKAA